MQKGEYVLRKKILGVSCTLSAKTLESKLLKVLEQSFKQVSPLEKLHKDSSSPSVAAIKDIFIFRQ